ncbi:radical SAM protein [Methanofollis tationis]|uniref:Radical SAM protein n=1 Tax=Methanofollis tationis TaxID=81417 RepID=A0A7K4HKQ6_9EURY|nr:radical SAM protein [Methanofollis tationis]NVO65843.1 radical SAM protein [Methanofollis tationis]
MTRPSYLGLLESGDLARRAEEARASLLACTLCPRRCGVDRLAGERGWCRSGRLLRVASAGPHFGEEPELVGRGGSGTIFFANCTMRCEFCQNYSISQCGEGEEVACADLARIMLRLQEAGCHNINLVSPTHYLPQILRALVTAAAWGLAIPLVYNTGGYDRAETIALLDGIVDIYMPDAKYGRDDVALALSHAPEYTRHMKESIREMHRQVGDLAVEDGVAVRGLIVRHLVLPCGLAGSREVFRFIADEVSPDTYVNVMDQYYPAWHAAERSADLPSCLHRRLSPAEYAGALEEAAAAGLHRGFTPPPGRRAGL